MLEFGWVPSVDRDSCSIYMQFADNTATPFGTPNEFWPEGTFVGAFPQPQKANENVLLWVLIREESFPTTVGGIIPSK